MRVVVLDREGTDRQHIDLCGGPLKKAMLLRDAAEELKGGPP